MLNRIFFVIEGPLSPSFLPEGADCYLSYTVRPSEEHLSHLYRHTEQSGGTGHMLVLDIGEGAPEGAALPAITSFLFRPGYVQDVRGPLLGLTGGDDAGRKEVAAVLSDFLGKQGFASIHISHILPGEGGDGRLFTSPLQMTEHYHHLLFEKAEYDNDLFFRPSSGEEATSVWKGLENVETRYREQRPREYALACQLLEHKKTAQLLAAKNGYLAAELENQQLYVASLRSNHAAREIQDYYNNEYELLPLWYKRFGHMLKVLTGKRTFRSLFRDDVKKYKD